jgi:hypothetical protein
MRISGRTLAIGVALAAVAAVIILAVIYAGGGTGGY